MSLRELATWLDELYGVVNVANQYRTEGAPFAMRAGLYQGNAIGNSAGDAYMREANGKLLPAVAENLKERLVANTADPDRLYEYLKAYLMLGHPEHLDKAQLSFLVDLEWERAFAQDPDLRQSLTTHFTRLLDQSAKLRALA